MEKFSISAIRDIFAADLERFATETSLRLLELLHSETPSAEALADIARQAHTLKGLAATVEAWGLSRWGADLEVLFELAGTQASTDRDRASEIFRFALTHMNDWQAMNQFTVEEKFPLALECYQRLRAEIDERWGSYLQSKETPAGHAGAAPEPGPTFSSAPAQTVGETATAFAPVSTARSTLTGRPLVGPLPLVPPPLRRKKVTVPAEAQTQAPRAGGPLPLPAALPLKPPALMRRTAKPVVTAPPVAPPQPLAAMNVPRALPLVPPTLKVRGVTRAPGVAAAASSASPEPPPVAAPSPTPTPQPEPTPPICEPPVVTAVPVKSPSLKRRSRKTAKEPAKTAAAVVAPTPAPVSAVEVPAAPAVEATTSLIVAPSPDSTPSTVSTPLTSPPTAAPLVPPASGDVTPSDSPSADSDLLDLLRGEVAGYITELTDTLRQLAPSLDQVPVWENTRRLFHTIKGTAATFHLTQLSTPAKAAEARCIVAVEEAQARSQETFETCLDRAKAIADVLNLPFERDALAAACAAAAPAPTATETPVETPTTPTVPEDSVDAGMVEFFVRDVQDMIGTIEQAILKWERGEDPAQQVAAAQRGFHTVKGAANSIGFKRVGLDVHEAESFLDAVAAGTQATSPPVFSFFLTAVDQLRHFLKSLQVNPAAQWSHQWADALNVLRGAGGAVTSAVTPPAGAPAPTPSATPASTPASASAAATPTTPSFRTLDVGPVLPSVDPSAEEAQTLRIDASRLHELMNWIGQMVVDRSRLEKKLDRLVELQNQLRERNHSLAESITGFQQQFEFNLLKDRKAAGKLADIEASATAATSASAKSEEKAEGEFSELEFDRYDQFSILARQLVEIAHDIEQLNGDAHASLDAFAAENTLFRQTSRVLQEKVVGLSLVPVSTLYPRLQRAFRDAAVVEEKDAALVLEGEGTMLDKTVVDRIYAPLLHLLRNSVSHGVEDPATREKLGKPPRGTVRFRTAQLSNQILITLSDDGPGVRVDAVRQRAIAKGWLPADTTTLSPEQAVQFIFQTGFSTAEKITSVSGRGIGLDVVRKEIQALNGSIDLKWESGQGSTWTIRLPLTMSISEAIFAEAGGRAFAFPLNFLETGLVLESERFEWAGGRETYTVGDDKLPLIRLSDVLDLPASERPARGIIVSAGDQRVVFGVDRLLNRQEIVVKQLDEQMAQHPLLNGATLDAEGRVVPILNLPALLRFAAQLGAQGVRRRSADITGPKRGDATGSQQVRVLIVDDSLSVRKVQERFLKALGAEVMSATDGLHALERLRENKFDLVFTDLEMPRLNGYELITEVRSNPAWSALPMVVISSRGGDKYITKAMNLGANSFLSKPFTEQQLDQVLRFYAGWDGRTRSKVPPTVAA